jgi:hypothetical protein
MRRNDEVIRMRVGYKLSVRQLLRLLQLLNADTGKEITDKSVKWYTHMLRATTYELKDKTGITVESESTGLNFE